MDSDLTTQPSSESGKATCGFFVRVWQENTESEEGPIALRGHILNVLTRKKSHFNSLSEIPSFIQSHFEFPANL